MRPTESRILILASYLVIIASVISAGVSAQANTCVDVMGVVRNVSLQGATETAAGCSLGNDIAHLTWSQALQSCPTGTHLPTVRELALRSHDLGAFGFPSPNTVRANPGHRDALLVSAIDLDNSQDIFYFDSHGYQAPHGSTGSETFWSSSHPLSDSRVRYVLDGRTGELGVAISTNTLSGASEAVLCIVGSR